MIARFRTKLRDNNLMLRANANLAFASRKAERVVEVDFAIELLPIAEQGASNAMLWTTFREPSRLSIIIGPNAARRFYPNSLSNSASGVP